jgi:hypothetical protein
MNVQYQIAHMIRILICLLALPFLTTFSAFSQCGDGGIIEIECVRDSILKIHRNDEFYLHIRPLPDVRESIEDYVLTKDSDKWTCKYFKTTYDQTPSVGTNHTPRKKIMEVFEINENLMASFLKSIDSERLRNFKNSDSILLNNSDLMHGTSNNFIIICSNGSVRLIEYPVIKHYDQKKDWRTQNIYWQSNFLDDLIAKFKQAF